MKWIKCQEAQFHNFVNSNSLQVKTNGMDMVYYDNNNNILARIVHGFVEDEYLIFTEENLETLHLVTKIFNNEQRAKLV